MAGLLDRALEFLLGNKKRVIALYKYGQHLSHQLVEMVKDLLPEEDRPALPTIPHGKRVRRKTSAEIFGHHGHEASPYLDDPPVVMPRHAAHARRVAPASPVVAAPQPVAPAQATKKKRSRGGRGRRSQH